MIKIAQQKVTVTQHKLDPNVRQASYYAVYYIPRTSENLYLNAIFAGQRQALNYRDCRQKESKGRSNYYVTRVRITQAGMVFPDLDSSPDSRYPKEDLEEDYLDDYPHPDDLDLG